LTQMMASENGQSSPVPSFDEYLQVSENLQQKLLVEIKTSKADSPQFMQHFLQTYGKRLVAGGHQMQSLDYDVVEAVKKFDDKLLAAFILPFNSIYPTTVADGYTME
ncbi:PI-PLC domain-containing protein, partial [Streptococcus pyogenes]